MKCVFLTEILWEMYTSCVASTYFGVTGIVFAGLWDWLLLCYFCLAITTNPQALMSCISIPFDQSPPKQAQTKQIFT